jgi:NADH dehydrogenase [ubiquinone] 1 alpha subcomplex assembly factor 3
MERHITYCPRFLWKAFNSSSIFQTPPHCSSGAVAASPRQVRAPLLYPRPTGRRCIHVSRPLANPPSPPKSRYRGPKSNEDTQTDFNALDVLRNTAAPATSIDACTDDGFALNNQTRVSGSGVLLVGGEAFRWRPWIQEARREGTATDAALDNHQMAARLMNRKGQWEVPESAWGVLELVYPKPGK